MGMGAFAQCSSHMRYSAQQTVPEREEIAPGAVIMSTVPSTVPHCLRVGCHQLLPFTAPWLLSGPSAAQHRSKNRTSNSPIGIPETVGFRVGPGWSHAFAGGGASSVSVSFRVHHFFFRCFPMPVHRDVPKVARLHSSQ